MSFVDRDVILEGFLCPICHEDLKTPGLLTVHVESAHSEQDKLKPLKNIFGLNKRRILDEASSNLGKLFDSNQPRQRESVVPYETVYYHQEVGKEFSHFDFFKGIRSARVDRYANETNKMIIRLHKLLTNRPEDAVKRKQHEQQLVPWVEGKLVKLCPSCAKRFNLAIRRQHHCRLCGSIMCNDCSFFLNVEIGLALLNPAEEANPLPLAVEIDETFREKDNVNNLRVCEHCLHLLETRKEQQDSRNYRPLIIKIYDKIQELKKEISPDIGTYIKIIDSLLEGDSIFTIQDGSALRMKIGRIAERIDTLSKQILSLPAPQGSREETLKKSIRMACIAYIKEDLLILPQIPTEEEILRIQEQRRIETEKKIDMERRLAAEAMDRLNLSSEQQFNKPFPDEVGESSASGSAIHSVDSWSGHQADVKSSTNDPLVEQINIIKSYIKQARQALRFEEVAILETNLRELQQEFYQRQQNTSS